MRKLLALSMMSPNRVDIDGLSASVMKSQSVEQLSLGRRIASYVRASMLAYRDAGVEQGGEGPRQGEKLKWGWLYINRLWATIQLLCKVKSVEGRGGGWGPRHFI